MSKTTIQRALPLTDKYTVISTSYLSLLDGGGTACQNCGKLITNMVTIVNQHGNKYIVGSDCAETLVLDKLDFMLNVKNVFNEGKSIRAKILKKMKEKPVEDIYYYHNSRSGHFIVLRQNGRDIMTRLCFPQTTVTYLSDLFTKPSEIN